MRLRGVCTLIALSSLLWISGCCWDRGCCRAHHRGCGCACESSCYTPSCGCEAGPPLAAPGLPMPVQVMPGGAH